MLFSSFSVLGEWKNLNPISNVITHQIETTSIKKIKGDTYRAWSVWNTTSISYSAWGEYRSLMVLEEFDCNNEKHRELEEAGFDGEMGQGLEIYKSSRGTDWQYIRPNEVNDTYDYVCKTFKKQTESCGFSLSCWFKE